MYMKTMIVSLTRSYVVLVNVARCCRNLVWLSIFKISQDYLNLCLQTNTRIEPVV